MVNALHFEWPRFVFAYGIPANNLKKSTKLQLNILIGEISLNESAKTLLPWLLSIRIEKWKLINEGYFSIKHILI